MLEEQVKNANEENIKKNLIITKRYSSIIHVLIIFSKIVIIISGLLSFASTRFEYIWILSFLSGSFNFLATSLLSYSDYLVLQRKKIIKNTNSKLEKLNIKTKILVSETDEEKSI